MKSLAFLTMLYCANPMHAEEKPFETLKQLESCYDAIQPAFVNTEEAFVWLSDIPHPLFNAVMHLSSPTGVDELLKKIPAENPISFWVNPESKIQGLEIILKNLGFSPAITCPVMGCPVRSMPPLGYDIRPAEPETFYQIVAKIFQFDELVKKRYKELMGKIHTEDYLIYLNGKPVGTGTLFPNGETGGIFNISTLPEYQRRGCAKAMMHHLMDRAYQLKLKQLVLLSSQTAEKLYQDLGFKKAFDVDIYAKEH